MENLKVEVNKMLEIFDFYKIPERKQREIITNGVFYCFSFGTDREGIDRAFDCFKVARLLQFCKCSGIAINANKLVGSIYDYQEDKDLIHSFDKLDKTKAKLRKKEK